MSTKQTGYKRKRSSSAGPARKKTYKKTAASRAITARPRLRTGSRGASRPVQIYTTEGVDSAAAVMSSRAEYSSLSDCSKDLILSILDPEMCMNPERWPNTYGVSALFKSKNVLNATFTSTLNDATHWSLDGANRSAIVVYPQLKNAIFTTTAVQNFYTVVVPKAHTNYAVNGNNTTPTCYQNIQLAPGSSIHLSQPFFLQNSRALFPFPNTTTGSLTYSMGPNAVPAAGHGNVMSFWSDAPPGSFSLQVNTYNKDFTGAVNYDAIWNGAVAVTGDGEINTYSEWAFLSLDTPNAGPTVPQLFDIRIQANNNSPVSANLIIEMNAGANAVGGELSMRIYPTAQLMDYVSISNSTQITTASDEAFVVAQSLLATFEGASLTNAGALAIGRLPARTQMGLIGNQISGVNNWYEYMANLPINNYNGPTKKGGYCWYLGNDEDAYFYSSAYRNYNINDSYMVCECTTSDITQTAIRWMVNTIVQFATNSTAYNQAPSEYVGQDLQKIRHLLSNIPAAYENPSHRDQLTKMLKSVGTQVWKLAKNPNTYKKIAQAIQVAKEAGQVIGALA